MNDDQKEALLDARNMFLLKASEQRAHSTAARDPANARTHTERAEYFDKKARTIHELLSEQKDSEVLIRAAAILEVQGNRGASATALELLALAKTLAEKESGA